VEGGDKVGTSKGIVFDTKSEGRLAARKKYFLPWTARPINAKIAHRRLQKPIEQSAKEPTVERQVLRKRFGGATSTQSWFAFGMGLSARWRNGESRGRGRHLLRTCGLAKRTVEIRDRWTHSGEQVGGRRNSGFETG